MKKRGRKGEEKEKKGKKKRKRGRDGEEKGKKKGKKREKVEE